MGIYESTLHGFLCIFVLAFVLVNLGTIPAFSENGDGRNVSRRLQAALKQFGGKAGSRLRLRVEANGFGEARTGLPATAAATGECALSSTGTDSAARVENVFVSKEGGAVQLEMRLDRPIQYSCVYDRGKKSLLLNMKGVDASGVAGRFPPLAFISGIDIDERGGGLELRFKLADDVDFAGTGSREGRAKDIKLVLRQVEGGGRGWASVEQLLPQERTQLADDLVYERHRFRGGLGGADVHVLKCDIASGNIKLDLKLGKGTILGRERLSAMAGRAGALAAVNASFFAGNGEPLGLVSRGRRLLSVPVFRRSCFGIFRGKSALLGNPGFSGKVESDFGEFYLDGVNQQTGAANSILVYLPEFGSSTHTKGDGLEMAISGGRVVALQTGDTPIPPDGFVVGTRGVPPATMSKVGFWDKVQYHWGLTPPWDVSDFAVGGGPRLLSNGEVSVSWKEERFSSSFARTRAPRTAVGVSDKGAVLFVVVDGRDKPKNVGVTLDELARIMRRLHCRDALNLDGGGSSAMWVRGKIVNRPSDGSERAISSAIVIKGVNPMMFAAEGLVGRSGIRGT